MPNTKNLETVKNLKTKLAKAKSIILAEFHGLKSNDTNALRARMLEQGAEVTVAKNTLLKKAMEEEKMYNTKLDDHLQGSTAAILSYNDPLSPIKALYEFAKKLNLPKIKAALIDGRFTTSEEIEIISKLPTREQLIAQLLGSLKSPISGFTNVLGGTRNKLVYVLHALSQRSETAKNKEVS